MLHEFLSSNRVELISRCRAKVAQRHAPDPIGRELEFGIPIFLTQLTEILRQESQESKSSGPCIEIAKTAGYHGAELLLRGFTLDQIVHDYGDLCQAVTELATESNAPITNNEFHTFNRCLDNAIADAVSEFARERDQVIADTNQRTMNESLGFLAHEIRNPLTSLKARLYTLEKHLQAVPAARKDTDIIGAEISRLERIVQDVLSFARPSDPKLNTIAVETLLREIQGLMTPNLESRGVQFVVELGPDLFIRADSGHLKQVLINLLSNAVKFTPTGGGITITLRRERDDCLAIAVSDTGIGIRQEDVAVVMAPFGQVDTGLNRKFEGTGLGLPLTKAFVEMHGGRMTLESELGKGTTVMVTLPAKRVQWKA
jgi:hypothetical protein